MYIMQHFPVSLCYITDAVKLHRHKEFKNVIRFTAQQLILSYWRILVKVTESKDMPDTTVDEDVMFLCCGSDQKIRIQKQICRM